jgi:misacylated tRNA(Ala) deacylase
VKDDINLHHATILLCSTAQNGLLKELKQRAHNTRQKRIVINLDETPASTRLLYYEDAYLKEFVSNVTSSEQVDGRWGIILDRTAFYPLGGGQPADTGIIKGLNGEATVKDVRTEHSLVVHTAEVMGKINGGEVVRGILDWSRRYALMRNHTLAHLMAEAIRKATGSPSEVVSSGLDSGKARLDVEYEGSLGPLLQQIQEVADRVIIEDRPVEIKIMQRTDAEEYVARFHESLKTLPPHVQNVRIVEVKDWHACACGGLHVKSTGEIGAIEILKRTSKGKGVERIEFRAKTS